MNTVDLTNQPSEDKALLHHIDAGFATLTFFSVAPGNALIFSLFTFFADALD